MRIYSTERARKIVEENAPLIDSICTSICLPPASAADGNPTD